MKKAILIFAVTFFAVNVLSAQGFPEQRWRERLLEFKKVRLLEILKLDEQSSVRFLNKYTKFSNELDQLELEREKLVNEMEIKLKRGDKEGYDKSIQELFELGKKEYEIRLNFYKELKDVLTEQQIAQVIVFERNFRREFINAIRDIQRERMRKRF
jgi:hypothetical protein